MLRLTKALLKQASQRGRIRVDSPSTELTVRCVIELTWTPEQIVHAHGKRAALIHARDTVLHGVVTA